MRLRESHQIHDFRQLMFQYGEQAINQFTDDLLNVQKEKIKSEKDGAQYIDKMDFLHYLAKYKVPKAVESIKKIALQNIDNEISPIKNNMAQTYMVLEAFETYSSIHPKEAADAINEKTPNLI